MAVLRRMEGILIRHQAIDAALRTWAAAAFTAAAQKYEADYVELIRQELGGRKEVPVASGFVDLVTDDYAIEVEFAANWKHSIGQALWYGLQAGKTPAVVLVKKDNNDHKYVIQFGSALQYAGLDNKIRLWVWPDDFRSAAAPRPEAYEYRSASPPPPAQGFWLTTSSNKRHNAGCRHFRKSGGRFCGKGEGIACKVCGG